MTISGRHGLLLRTSAAVIGLACLVGTLFIAQTLWVTSERTYAQATAGLGELIDTVESTVSIACFVSDQALAAEVVRGLLKNRQVREVVISAGGQELARAHRDHAPATRGDTRLAALEREIYSPFDAKKRVGKIRLEPNTEEIRRGIYRETRFFGVLLILELVIVVGTVVFMVLRTVVRPIKTLSDGLHRMDAMAGERLAEPPGHTKTEIGRLVSDVNDLACRMVAAMEEERAVSRQRELEERRYRAIFDNAEIGIFTIDSDGLLGPYNPALLRLLEISEPPTALSLQSLPWRQPRLLLGMMAQCLESGGPITDDLELIISGSLTRWINIILSPVEEHTAQGLLADVTERKRAEMTAKQEVVTDPLTGLANRIGFERAVNATIRTWQKALIKGFALMTLKLDGFRRIHDTMGFAVGDQILMEVARRIKNCLKVSDTVARLDDDKFALLLPKATTDEQSTAIGNRILNTLAHHFDIQDTSIQLGASIGITLFPGDGHEIPALLRNAEMALDRASKQHTLSFFDPSMAEAAERRGALETDLRLALRREEFQLFFQPIVDLNDYHVVGAEALIRWFHPRKGLVSPDAFIPLAEETGMICDVGLWGLESACRQLCVWQSLGWDHLYLSTNISGRQIPDGLKPEQLAQITRRYGVEPSRLVLEITEGVLLVDVTQAQVWLTAVRELGFRIYLDDFGTGYSSLSYLKKLAVDTVKIDKSFIRDMGTDNNDRALVKAIIAMTRSLGLNIVAEGVETLQHAALLRHMQCHIVQGFLFSKPVPGEEFASALARIESMVPTGQNEGHEG